MAFKVGDRVTVNEKTYRGHIPRSITTVVNISARVLKTEDGKRWHPTRGGMLDSAGHELKSNRIYAHQKGDELKIQRIQWMAKAHPLFDVLSSFEDDVHLISNDDLQVLAEIGERLKIAKERAARADGEGE